MAPRTRAASVLPQQWQFYPGRAYDERVSARGNTPLIPLGYGKFVRADRVYALIPLEGAERGEGRRTLVYVEGMAEPLVASRSESAIAADMAAALGLDTPRGRRAGTGVPGQEVLF